MIGSRYNRLVRQWAKRGAIGGITCAGVCLMLAAILWHAFPFPVERLERWPASPCVTDRTGRTLLKIVAADDQWRSPVPLSRMSPWVVNATVAVEDERFWSHPGIDPIAVTRALGQAIRAGRVVSGASTLSMQICRMLDGRPRTWRAKAVESFRALQLECIYSKEQILELYLNIAPYGGNLRGVQAASHAYFGTSVADLSLAEAALLAGLPQSPTRYRPDRHPDAARNRRGSVLRRMVELGMITKEQRDRASAEPVRVRPHPSTHHAPHAAWLALQRRPGGGQTTIDLDLQPDVERLVAEQMAALPVGTDAAVVVIDIPTADILAMVGSADFHDPLDGEVNGTLARRSPGSTLKPFIYAAAFEARRLHPQSHVYDVPIHRAGWSPANFDGTFAGQVSAAEALRRSLNVPAILVAEEMGLGRCLGLIEAAGVSLPPNAQSRGGLGVAVGALEVTLVDLTNAYATLGRHGCRLAPRLFLNEQQGAAVSVIRPEVCTAINDILSSRNRPPHGRGSLAPRGVPWFMWKTGTSSGRRDAWAVGHNERYAVGVWVGRFSGAGSTEYVGAHAAEPLLTGLFMLPRLRVDLEPASPAFWAVTRPIPPPMELDQALRILLPADGAAFIALSDTVAIQPQANRVTGITWFLDGRYAAAGNTPRLIVPPGVHELRCAGSDGASLAVRFTVRDAHQETTR